MNLGISPAQNSPTTVLSDSRELIGLTNQAKEGFNSANTNPSRFSKSSRDNITTSTSVSKTPRSANMTLKENSLPPNTGPPGSVNSTTSSNKNLSHVPCKFFKQGICQAGNSCPFSHNLDGTLGADKLPCKYFQKGNCKFGLKCALAHYLPDGTRVNSKSLLVREGRRSYNGHGQGQGQGHNQGQSHNQGHGQGQGQGHNQGNHNFQVSGNIPTSTHSNFQNNPSLLLQNMNFKIPQNVSVTQNSAFNGQNSFNSTSTFNGGYSQFKNSTPPSSKPIDITFDRSMENVDTSPSSGSNNSGFFSGPKQRTNSFTSSDTTLGLVSNNFNGGIVLSNMSHVSNSYSGGITNNSNGPFQSTPSAQTLFRSYSTNTSPVALNGSPAYSNFYGSNSQFYHVTPNSASSNGNSKFSFASRLPSQQSSSGGSVQNQNPFSTSSYYYNNVDTSAIVDDDDSHLNSAGDNSDVFEEDYVPGSLSDLILTPQELVRRDSRSQSGTLLLRPNLLSLLNSAKDDDNQELQHSQSQHHSLPFQNGAFRKNSMEVPSHQEDVFLME